MSDTSRRKFLAAAGVGAAASAAALGTAASAEAKPSAKRAKEPVIALVDDHTKGTVRLLVGEREVVVHDRDLATRLLNAAGGQ
ncbi:twin-arginine translocation signal domain-containing protein [Nocardioides sp.]|uniref:twin-arginine translocation signal domain-containing protein n=1 Tax=Nocardioides sp. TaxID=35761 RepID=UPI002718D6EE|nr:twin-arginine translocation signal domain-containing protein [Nocardioides sp.]MDO9456472.1 twin-arginine translocation signal domain-containing protein [Nocardioides sp.]